MEREILHRLLYDMLLARTFEAHAAEEYAKRHIAGFRHLYPGEEAVAAGVIEALGPSDYVVSAWRERAHALIRGIPARERHGGAVRRATGVSGGMGGSMHLFDRERRFMGGYAIVGGDLPDRDRNRLRGRDAPASRRRRPFPRRSRGESRISQHAATPRASPPG